jgi:hypothetical protein
MFTLYMKWEAQRKLAPGDIQFILTPREALEMASIFYELDYLEYDQHTRIIPHRVPKRREGVHHRYAAQPYKRKYRTEYDGLYDEVKWNLEHGWMIGVNTRENDLGRFFSYEKPQGVLQAHIDKAILPEWPDGSKSIIDSYYETKIPAGTKVYVGEVGYQTDIYSGGTEQVVIPAPWEIPGVETLNFGGLK